MSVHDELRSLQRCVDDLSRSVGRLERGLGADGGLELRRVRLDADRLKDSVALLQETTDSSPTSSPRQKPNANPSNPSDGSAPSTPTPPVILVPDTPYDSALWADADDEGLGARYGSQHPHGTSN
jgi:hypothetical protein